MSDRTTPRGSSRQGHPLRLINTVQRKFHWACVCVPSIRPSVSHVNLCIFFVAAALLTCSCIVTTALHSQSRLMFCRGFRCALDCSRALVLLTPLRCGSQGRGRCSAPAPGRWYCVAVSTRGTSQQQQSTDCHLRPSDYAQPRTCRNDRRRRCTGICTLDIGAPQRKCLK